jgi:hypothetical protein
VTCETDGRTDGQWYTIIRHILKTGIQKSLNQNGGIIGSTNHDDQSSYQI